MRKAFGRGGLCAAFLLAAAGVCRAEPSFSVIGLDAEPGTDYNGSTVVLRIGNVEFDGYSAADLYAEFSVNGKTYQPTAVAALAGGMYKFTFAVDGKGGHAVLAGESYDGTLSAGFDTGEGAADEVVQKSLKLVQGEMEAGFRDWFEGFPDEPEAPCFHEIKAAAPNPDVVRIEAEFNFTGAGIESTKAPTIDEQVIRIVEDGHNGYKFQFYGKTGMMNDPTWQDANDGLLAPVPGNDYQVRIEVYYDEVRAGHDNNLIFWAKDGRSNEYTRLFVGNLPYSGSEGSLARVRFDFMGTIYYLQGWSEEETVLPPYVARVGGVSGYVEKLSVAEAVAALGQKDGTICLLHSAGWAPTSNDVDRVIRFENRSLLVLTEPAGYEANWSDVSGNVGTLTFVKSEGGGGGGGGEEDVHTHDFVYGVSGDSITVTCRGEGGKPCAFATSRTATLVVADADYTGAPTAAASVRKDAGFTGAVTLTYFRNGTRLPGAPTDVGAYSVTMSAGGCTVLRSFAIAPRAIDSLSISAVEFTCDGEEKSVRVTEVRAGSLVLASSDYTVSGDLTGIGSRLSATTFVVTVDAANPNFTGSASRTWTIRPPSDFISLSLYPDGEGGVFLRPVKASEYAAVLVDAGGGFAGTLTVKTSKPTAAGLMDISATVKTLADKQTYSYKAKKVPLTEDGPLALDVEGTNAKSKAFPLSLVFEGDALVGTYGEWRVDGARDVFKVAKHPKRDALVPYVGGWTGAFEYFENGSDSAGRATFSATVAKSGTATISGTLPDGTAMKCSSARVQVGANGLCAFPVVWQKTVSGRQLAVGFRLVFDPAESRPYVADVSPLTSYRKVDGIATVGELSFIELGQPAMTKNEFKALTLYGLEDMAELKNSLSYNVKTGCISGSLKWTMDVVDSRGRTKTKTVSAKASGVVIGSVGYGSAKATNVGTFSFTLR